MRLRKERRRWNRNRRGAVVVLVGVTLVVLMGMLVLAIDGGNVQRQRRIAQTAADAAALAGAVEIFRNRPDSIIPSALSESKRNGFEHGVGGDVVAVTYPSTRLPYTGPKYVAVTVQRTSPSIFASFFGLGSVVVRSHATAGVTLGEYCFIVLDPSGDGALTLNNSAQLRGSGCGIEVNSTSPIGANIAGRQAVVDAEFIAVSGPSVGGLSNFVTDPEYNVPPTPNPMSQLAMPSVPNTCDYGSATAPAVLVGNITLNPGTYCGGMIVGGNLTLSPGLYILRGGGLSVVGGGYTLRATGSGVTFLNTAPPAGATYGWGSIFIQAGSVTLDLWANTDPDSELPGVLFYTDPAAPFMVNLFKAGSVSRMDGTMYFPTGKVVFESGATFTINGALVAYQVELSQQVNVTFTGYGGGSEFLALRKVTVVE